MENSRIEYEGPIPRAITYAGGQAEGWRKLPWGFIGGVILPTLIAAIYFLLIATPRYVSEARFIVRAPAQSQPSSLGVALQGVGLTSGQTDAFAVHEYINSRDGLRDLTRRYDLAAMLGSRNADPFSRYPRFWESRSEEGLFQAFQRFVTVGYDSTTGISTLRVEAFNPQDASRLSEGLLAGGESLVNRLNTRATSDAVVFAQRAQGQARERLATAESDLTTFRNRERFIDPARTATESSQLIGGLLETVATLRAERAQIVSQSPQSPQLPILDSRIAAFEAQITAERLKIVGTSSSLAPKISIYEDLIRSREFSEKELAQATAQLLSAEQDASRQKLYLDRVVNPQIADRPTEPRRLIAILTVFIATLMAYGVGWLVWAGVREHRQD